LKIKILEQLDVILAYFVSFLCVYFSTRIINKKCKRKTKRVFSKLLILIGIVAYFMKHLYFEHIELVREAFSGLGFAGIFFGINLLDGSETIVNK
jgi:uncharacterized membrane protein